MAGALRCELDTLIVSPSSRRMQGTMKRKLPKTVTRRPQAPRLPPLPFDVLRRVEEIEGYLTASIDDCERGLSFNTQKAVRLLRSCVVSVFEIQIQYYRALPGFSSNWIGPIVSGIVHSAMGQLGMRVSHFQRAALEGELARTLIEHVATTDAKPSEPTMQSNLAQRTVESIAKQLVRLRAEAHITMEELAGELDVDPRSVFRHFSGESSPRDRHLAAYERVFSDRLKTKVVIRKTSG